MIILFILLRSADRRRSVNKLKVGAMTTIAMNFQKYVIHYICQIFDVMITMSFSNSDVNGMSIVVKTRCFELAAMVAGLIAVF